MASALSFRSSPDADALRFVPLGGCGEFGMNLTAMLWRGRLFVIDAGVRFPDPSKLGIDAILPDVDPWFREAGGVAAYIITHGHEDHIGALPHLIRRWPAPIYAPPWAAALIGAKFARFGVDAKQYPVKVVEAGDKLAMDDLTIEYIRVNHSLPDTCSIFIKTPKVHVFHTGDFKFEENPVIEERFDEKRLAAIGNERVDLMLVDSTNAEKSGNCPEESSVLPALVPHLERATGATFITTFSSNLWRLKMIADACIEAGKKLFITGNGIETTLTHAKALGRYYLPETLRLADGQLDGFRRDRMVVLASGCQAEWRSAMCRIANGEHRSVGVHPGDQVILSSRFIPGNERPILDMMDKLKRLGASVISPREFPGIHVSGHAYGGDIERLIKLLRPKVHAPVHGAFTQLDANRKIGERLGVKSVLIETGDVLEVSPNGVATIGKIDTGINYLDAESGVVLPIEAARERLRVGELGQAIFSGVFSRSKRDWAVAPSFEIFGFRLPARLDWPTFQKEAIEDSLELLRVRGSQKGPLNQDSWDELLEELRISLRRKLTAVLNKKPVVFVKLHLM